MLAYRSLHFTKLSLIICVVLSSSYYFLFRDADLNYHNVYKIAVSGKKALFVDSVMNTAIDGSFDNSTLVQMCAGKQWQEGLIFKCEPPYGDAIEVRNVFLNCVRFALEAGATSFIVPELKSLSHYIPKRGVLDSIPVARRRLDWPDMNAEPEDEDTPRLRPDPAHIESLPFDHYFDLDHFKSSLSAACPQMHVIAHLNDLYDVPSTGKTYVLRPERLTKSFYAKPADSVLAVPSEWRSAFDDWLNATTPVPSAKRPILVALKDPYLQFPLAHDSPEFVSQFGKIIRPRADVRELAATVLFAMNKDFSHLSYMPTHGIQSRKFYGAQILSDEIIPLLGNNKATPYKDQEKQLISAAQQNHLSLIYLGLSISPESEESASSTSAPSPLNAFSSISHPSSQHLKTISEFIKTAKNHSLTVVTRSSLLSNPTYATAFDIMNSLPLDVQQLVDYEVFLKSSVFGGSWESPLAWAVAMRRHVVWGRGTWKGLEAGKGRLTGTLKGMEENGGEGEAEWAFWDGERDGGRDGVGSGGGGGNGTAGRKYGLSVIFGPQEEADGAFANALWP